MIALRRAVLLMCNLLALAGAASAQDDPFAFRYSIKASGLGAALPDVAGVFPEPRSATALWRARLEPTIQPTASTRIDLAFEQRLRVYSSTAALAGAGVLPAEAPAPFRIRQLDWQLASGSNAEWRAEVDRASVRLQSDAATVTIGRQAIGWGRGVVFGAIDLFAPFTPLEADREWRRGIDAVHADVRVTDRLSLDGVGAVGESIDDSAFVGRLRGYAREADVELVGGRRARDLFAGAASSAAVGDAELHGELAVFRTPATAGSTVFAADRTIVKAVGGASYQFAIGNGLLVSAEYHYSGFGAPAPSGILPALLDPEFRARYLRGDTQILGRHATAAFASCDWSPELTLSAEWLQSPSDGSGVFVPSATWTAGDRWSVMVNAYLPWGTEPTVGAIGSEFGSAPVALFMQVKFYR